MATPTTSHDLLAHFVGEVASDSRAAPRGVHPRGIRWVLQWSAAWSVLCLAALVLIEFAYLLAAEHALIRAAKAGALEATLPRASRASVAQSIQRRLADYPSLTGRLQFALRLDRVPVHGLDHARGGEVVSVALAAPSEALLPAWLRRVTFWHNREEIQVRAVRTIPGRRLD